MSELWYQPAPSFAVLEASILPDQSIYGSPLDIYTNIVHAANHNLFTAVFDQYLLAFSSLVKEATGGLSDTLNRYNIHQPHYSLFLTFLKLFEHGKNELNRFGSRHLDFYYRDVLRILPKAASPNRAHIIIELARHVETLLLEKNRLFKAGKDDLGKDVFYRLLENETFNKAKVTSLKSVYFGASPDDHEQGSSTVNNLGRLFASPIANSDDGLGKELTSVNKEWHPFVNRQYVDGKLDDILSPNGTMGFAIASHYLFMAEGERRIELRLACGDGIEWLTKMAAKVDVFLTGEKEWIRASGLVVSSGKMENNKEAAIFSFTLSGEVKPVMGYNAEKHGDNFQTSLPILKVVLINIDDSTYPSSKLRSIQISAAELSITVGNLKAYNEDGLKQLKFFNDNGGLDASKPFMPFGPSPRQGSSLIIGSDELFGKKNASLSLNLKWAGMPSSTSKIKYGSSSSVPTSAIRFLSGGKWQKHPKLTLDAVNIMKGTAEQVNPFVEPVMIPKGSIQEINSQNPFDSTTVNGFMKIRLNTDYGMKAYQDALVTYLVNKAADPKNKKIVKPSEPYTPILESVQLSYQASVYEDLSSASGFDDRQLMFFHILPFGVVEKHAKTGSSSEIYLFPHFGHKDKEGKDTFFNGELYIGLSQAKPQSNVNILFQVMEGSEDPKVIKPDEHIFWSYLSDDEWIAFEKQDVVDGTRQLVQSGIINFQLPAAITDTNRQLPSGEFWIKASIESASGAVAKLIAVVAQATLVEYDPGPENSPDFLQLPLPAATISKLKVPLAAVKKITQPFSSFGGRGSENSREYNARVSERLRHKSRAITIWDYEHLVLEAFPSIYKVKCLNHTRIDDGVYNEVMPGYVSIITIPDLANRNDINPLQPFTSQALLSQIEEYLAAKVPCYVQAKARNPQFEELRLSLKVKFSDGLDYSFYSKLLQEDITRFLSPWAFSGEGGIDFGGSMDKSVLINFIEERYYVNYITHVKMFQVIEGVDSNDLDRAIASTARSVLVSVPASKHVITEIKVKKIEDKVKCIDPFSPAKDQKI